MKRPAFRALQGAVLALGSPLGWLALRVAGGEDPGQELDANAGVYLYMLVGSVTAFALFGAYVGRKEEHERDTAMHDALTGLYNARYFHARLAEEIAFARRHDRPLSLLMGDIDFFKRVNDTYGHGTGDQVLAGVAGAFMAARRRGDTVARVGGEEFAVILPETDLAEATGVAERLRQSVGELKFTDKGSGRVFSVTISLGAVTSTCARPLESGPLFREADAALYRAKNAGRNRVSATA